MSGVTQQHLKDLTNEDLDARVINAGNKIDFIKQSFNPAATIGVGVGYQVNNWFRADVTGEYRTRSRYSATEQILRPDWHQGCRWRELFRRLQDRMGRPRQCVSRPWEPGAG